MDNSALPVADPAMTGDGPEVPDVEPADPVVHACDLVTPREGLELPNAAKSPTETASSRSAPRQLAIHKSELDNVPRTLGGRTRAQIRNLAKGEICTR